MTEDIIHIQESVEDIERKPQNIYFERLYAGINPCRITEALEYMVECTLATVEHIAGIKSRSNGEFKRQLNIATTGINCLMVCDIKPTNIRTKEVIEKFNGNVFTWIKKYDIKFL